MTEFGQRQAALLPSLPRVRLAAAGLALGAALAGAAVLHGYRVFHVYGCTIVGSCLYEVRHETPGWVNPVALGICLLGLAAAAGVLFGGRRLLRFTAAALTLAASVTGAVVLSMHRVLGGPHECLGASAVANCFSHPRPVWVVPIMVGLVVLGLAGASGILVATRHRSP